MLHTAPIVREAFVGALRITIASPSPNTYVVASEREGAPETRTARTCYAWSLASARFDRLVRAADAVQVSA